MILNILNNMEKIQYSSLPIIEIKQMEIFIFKKLKEIFYFKIDLIMITIMIRITSHT